MKNLLAILVFILAALAGRVSAANNTPLEAKGVDADACEDGGFQVHHRYRCRKNDQKVPCSPDFWEITGYWSQFLSFPG